MTFGSIDGSFLLSQAAYLWQRVFSLSSPTSTSSPFFSSSTGPATCSTRLCPLVPPISWWCLSSMELWGSHTSPLPLPHLYHRHGTWLSYTPLWLRCWIHWYTPLGIRKWSWLWGESLGGNGSCLSKENHWQHQRKWELCVLLMTFIFSSRLTWIHFLNSVFISEICATCRCGLHTYDSNYPLVAHAKYFFNRECSLCSGNDPYVYDMRTWIFFQLRSWAKKSWRSNCVSLSESKMRGVKGRISMPWWALFCRVGSVKACFINTTWQNVEGNSGVSHAGMWQFILMQKWQWMEEQWCRVLVFYVRNTACPTCLELSG